MPRHPVQPPEWIDAAPVRVERSVTVAAPPARVWELIADHAGWPEWFTDLGTVTVTRGATGVGGGRRVTIGKLAIEEEFTAWDVDEHFAFAVVASALPIISAMAESVRLTPLGGSGDAAGGCTVTYRQGIQGRPGCGRLVALAAKRMDARLAVALDNLRARAESTV